MRAIPAALLAVGLLAGCGSTVVTQVAPDATDPGCAEVLAALYGLDTLARQPRREVTAQSTAAWGEPAITLTCGVEPPGPTTQGCVSVNDIDWIGPRDPQSTVRTYTTYGRAPAVAVYVPTGSDAAIEEVLVELSGAVEAIKPARTCT